MTLRHFAALMVTISEMVWWTACGAPVVEPQLDHPVNLETVDPSGQEVVFWYQHTRMREEALLELIGDFNRVNAFGIQVKGEYAGKYSDIYNKMVVGLQGGELPELVVAYQNQAQAYYRAGGLVDIRRYMNSPKWGISTEVKNDYVAAFLEQDLVRGIQMGFPPNRSMEVLYYNRDWLDELGYGGPPRTWDAFAEMCRKAKDQPFSRSQTPERSLGFVLDTDASRAATMTFSRGGDFINAELNSYTFNTRELHASLDLMQQLIVEGAAELLSEPYGDTAEFSIGTVLFVLRSSSGLPFVKNGVESGDGFDWRVNSPPFEGDQPVVNVYGASLSVCKTTAEQQLAAWLFVKWFTEPQQQARWVRASNYFPVRKSTAQKLEEYFRENPNYERAYQLLVYGKSEPTVISYEAVRKLVSGAVVEIADGADVSEILAKLESAANELAAEMH